uniref:Uncharacterized protein n=1 Tax=Catagonus wagneri TaxID=51154 RepID=A0A8C3YK92_9CETA
MCSDGNDSPSLRTDLQNMEKARADLGCRVASRASLCLHLTARWSFLPPCVCPFSLGT